MSEQYGAQPNAIPAPGPGGGFISGLSAGLNQGQQIHSAWHQHAADKAAGDLAAGYTKSLPADGSVRPSLMENIKGHAEDFINNLVGTHFGMQKGPAPGGAIPAGGAPQGAAPAAPPATAPAPAPQVIPPPQGQAQAIPPMLARQAPPAAAPQYMDQGGPVYGPTPNAVPAPGPGGAAISGLSAGLNQGEQMRAAWHQHSAENAAGNYAHAIDSSLPGEDDQPKTLKDHFEGWASKLFGFGLNDAHKPNSQQGVAAPASAPASTPTPDASAQPAAPAPSSPQQGAPPGGPTPPQGATPPAPPSGGAPSPAAASTPAGASSAPAAPPSGGPAIPDGLKNASPEQQQATAAAVQSAAQQQGAPQEPPHSISHVDWNHLEHLKWKAIEAAARNGQDPNKVRESMDALQTGFMQSGILKNLSAANAAIMSGDNKAVEQAMKNVSYYLPNGQDLDMHRGPDGTLQYRDPFAPPGPDGKQPWTDVNAAHIQLLAQNAMDPSKVQETINAAHAQGAKIAHERAQDTSLLMTAEGRQYIGKARLIDADTRALIAPSSIYKNRAVGTYFLNRLGAQNAAAAQKAAAANKVPYTVANKAANDASASVAEYAQGQLETIPTMINGKPNDAPNAGKPMRNPEKIPEWLKGPDGKLMEPTAIAGIQSIAGKIGAANVGRMSKTEAAETAARVYKLTHPAIAGRDSMTYHTEGDQRKPDFVTTDNGTTGWLWQKGSDPKTGTWKKFNMEAELGQSFVNGESQDITPPMNDESMGDSGNPADYEEAQ